MAHFEQDTENIRAITALNHFIQQRRQCGKVLLEVMLHPPIDDDVHLLINSVIDPFVVHHWCHGIGGAWREISRTQARQLLRRLLSEDLAYRLQTPISDIQADQTAEQIFEFFRGTVRFFTNEGPGPGQSWVSLTSATFDTAVVLVDQERVGMLLVEDED